MREFSARAALHRAFVGDSKAGETAGSLSTEIDNPNLFNSLILQSSECWSDGSSMVSISRAEDELG
jgi:enterochelin esterase-like enzyme